MRTASFNSLLVALAVVMSAALSAPAFAESKATLNSTSKSSLGRLVAKVPAAKALNEQAIAVLVFPSITKAGLGVGGQYGDGVLFKGGKVAGYYNNSGASYGLQAGAQQFGYAMFLMNDKAVGALGANEGFEVGVGPSVVVVDEGKAKTMTTTTAKDDIYAFIFGQKGLMAGLGIQGNKITRLKD